MYTWTFITWWQSFGITIIGRTTKMAVMRIQWMGVTGSDPVSRITGRRRCHRFFSVKALYTFTPNLTLSLPDNFSDIIYQQGS